MEPVCCILQYRSKIDEVLGSELFVQSITANPYYCTSITHFCVAALKAFASLDIQLQAIAGGTRLPI